jgi:hypothetical protein
MVLALPRPAADVPDSAWQDAVQDGLDKPATRNPGDAIEAMLAIDLVTRNAARRDTLRLAAEPAASGEQARRQRASAVALHRALIQHGPPARPPTPPAGPLAAPGTAAAPDDTPETIVKWFDEIDDVELAIATEQERRQQAGEPPLPRKPGQPIVIYSYKPRDYIHKFTPDPRDTAASGRISQQARLRCRR